MKISRENEQTKTSSVSSTVLKNTKNLASKINVSAGNAMTSEFPSHDLKIDLNSGISRDFDRTGRIESYIQIVNKAEIF